MDAAIKLSYYKFLRKLIIFTLILGAIGYGVSLFLPDSFKSPTIPYLYIFFFSVSILVHHTLISVSIKRTTQFINYFMLLTFGKLIFYLSLILVYMLLYRSDILPFVGAFFILYLFFTIFEVNESLALTRIIKNSIKHKEPQA